MANKLVEAGAGARPAPAFPVLQFQFNKPIVRVGVIADTHVPDRIKSLPARIFDLFAGVDLILHAGDLCRPGILDELRAIAPVGAVQGNGDIFYRTNHRLPKNLIVEIGPVKIGLTHGHGGLSDYVKEKIKFVATGAYRHSHYEQQAYYRFKRAGVEAQAIVFGHTHYPVCNQMDGVLIFNPGPIGPDYKRREGPSIGWLTVDIAAKTVQGQIKFLAAP
jgi:hypothetical protein